MSDTSGDSAPTKPWEQPMPDEQFAYMRDMLAAPSPIGLEAAMTYGTIKPRFERFMPREWAIHQYKGNAGIVVDTHPGRNDLFTVMLIGHADKIRLQVRSIGEDGKIWVNSDSFLPMTLIGHEVTVFSEDPDEPGTYRRIEGGTIEAIGAIHFADANLRSGSKGITKEQLFLELHIHGEKKKAQIEALGVRPGDSILLHRPIRRGFSPNTFYGAYLDNGLGCFVTAEVGRLIAESGGVPNVRCLFCFTTYEEIGRFGSRVHAGELRPDAVIAIDVDHDYTAAPNLGGKRMQPHQMGKGFTLTVGAIASEQLNRHIEEVAREFGIPMQRDVAGRDTGTDAMAGVLAAVDCAAASVGVPIRNMHTISEAGHTGDVLGAVHVLHRTIERWSAMDSGKGIAKDAYKHGHPRLDAALPLTHRPPKETKANDSSADEPEAASEEAPTDES